ncbi:hybrid sensor histidine kinase/response regulator [Halobaculum halobium]|nr:GAF domain-containing protein [Halobaculum sp. SYNS20]
MRVLHVDGDPDAAPLTTTALADANVATVETATTAEEGLERLATEPFDCVVAEYALPDQSGIEVLKRVRDDHPLLPFVIYTNEGDDHVESDAYAAGATEYLPKSAGPDRHERAAERLRSAVGRYRAAGQSSTTPRRHALTSEVSEAIVRESTVDEAADRVCETLVDTGPFTAAGMAVVDAAGDGGDIAFRSLEHSTHDSLTAREDDPRDDRDGDGLRSIAASVASDALEAGRAVVGSTVDVDEESAIRADSSADDAAWPADIAELAALPFGSADASDDVLVVTADRSGTIDRSELDRLDRVADTVDHALRSFEARDGVREERNRRRAMFANAPTPVIEGEILDGGETHRIRDVNTAFEEAFGHEASEVIGADIADVVVPADRMAEHRALRTRIAAGEPILEEVVRKTADGEREFLLSGIPWGTDGDRASGWYVWHVDISDRKRRARAIEELHAATGTLVEATSPSEVAAITGDALRDVLDLPYNGVHLYDDREGGLVPVAWTDETEAMVGAPPTFDPGEGIAGQAYVTGEPKVYDDIADAPDRYNSDTPIRSEMALPLADHGVLLVGAPERDAFDDLDVSMARTLAEHATAVLHRIERETVLEQLQKHTQRLMHATTAEEIADIAVGTASDVLGAQLSGVHLVRDGGQRLEIVAYADSVESAFDQPPMYERGLDGDIAGEVVWAAFDSRTPQHIDDIRTHERLAEETPSRSVVVYPLDDHGVFIVSSTEPNAFDEPDKMFIEILATAVTAALDRVEREQELRRRNEHLDEFAGLISHDLRNPLNVAQGRLELARSETDSDHLDPAASAVERALSLLEESLAVARQGHDDGDVEPVDLAATVSACWTHTETAQAELRIETDQTLCADPSRLKQLLENLFGNAVKHGGDAVRVTVGDIPGGFYVADDGPGIPDDERDTAFEVGYTTDDESTGYGLYIVREIANAHGWEIDVVESEDGGARFEVTGVETVER